MEKVSKEKGTRGVIQLKTSVAQICRSGGEKNAITAVVNSTITAFQGGIFRERLLHEVGATLAQVRDEGLSGRRLSVKREELFQPAPGVFDGDFNIHDQQISDFHSASETLRIAGSALSDLGASARNLRHFGVGDLGDLGDHESVYNTVSSVIRLLGCGISPKVIKKGVVEALEEKR